jgi:hypothetical protein
MAEDFFIRDKPQTESPSLRNRARPDGGRASVIVATFQQPADIDGHVCLLPLPEGWHHHGDGPLILQPAVGDALPRVETLQRAGVVRNWGCERPGQGVIRTNRFGRPQTASGLRERMRWSIAPTDEFVGVWTPMASKPGTRPSLSRARHGPSGERLGHGEGWVDQDDARFYFDTSLSNLALRFFTRSRAPSFSGSSLVAWTAASSAFRSHTIGNSPSTR